MAASLNRQDERQVREFTHQAIKAALHDALFSPLTLGEKHDIRVKPKFETACWSYLPPHRIYVGQGIVGRAKASASQAQLTGYVKSHVRHELAHAHYTERNMRKVRQALKEIDAPFQLFNLFEDARIEDRYRREADYTFDWLVYEDLTFTKHPEGLLFGIIQSEGDIDKVREFLRNTDIEADRKAKTDALAKQAAEAESPAQQVSLLMQLAGNQMGPPVPPELERAQALETFEKVAEFYRRMVVSPDTAGIYPVLEDWMKEFGKPESAPSMGCGGEPGDKSDLEIGAELAENDDVREAFEADTEEVKAGKDGNGEAGNKGKATADESAEPKARKGFVLQTRQVMPDLGRADRLADKLKKFFQAEARRVATTTPQRKVSARHYAIGRPYYRVAQLQGKKCQKLLIEVDCSGSMSGYHIEEGKVLLAALSRLARQGYVEGHVVLSAGSPPRWELYELPMQDKIIANIAGFAGSEALEPTLRDHLSLARDADYVFVYTDAQITDRPIDKALLHRYGIHTWGLYAGDRGDFHEEMQKYFDKSILRENAEALVDAMLTQKK